MRDSANGRLVVNCPESIIIPNYSPFNYGNVNKSCVRVGQFSRDVDVTINGDLINRHNVVATGLGGGQINYACLELFALTDSVNFPRITINGNLDSLNSPCVVSGFLSRYGEINIYGNMIARFASGGFAGSPFWLQLTNGGVGDQTFRIRDGYCQGSSRFIIGRGKFVYIVDYSIYTSDFGGTQDSNFFLEQTGTTNQELYLYNTICEKGGAIGA
jgi:hypothetical protein